MRTLDEAKLITCVLPKGKARAVVKALKDECGIVAANVNYARGTGRMTHRAFRKTMTVSEKEILQVVVPRDREEELFAFIFDRAGIDQPHGGMMYQTDLAAASLFELPDLPEER